MEFIRSQVLEIEQKEAIRRLKHVVEQQGFKTTELEIASEAREQDGQAPAPSTFVFAFCQQFAPRLADAAEGAHLLLTTTFLVRKSGNTSAIDVLAPKVLSLVPEQQELQTIVDEMQSLVDRILDDITRAQQNEQSADVSADRVKQRLYEVILNGLDAIAQGDLAESSEDIFTLAKKLDYLRDPEFRTGGKPAGRPLFDENPMHLPSRISQGDSPGMRGGTGADSGTGKAHPVAEGVGEPTADGGNRDDGFALGLADPDLPAWLRDDEALGRANHPHPVNPHPNDDDERTPRTGKVSVYGMPSSFK